MAATKPSHVKLMYFNLRGRCESIRYLFAAVNYDYEDHRIEGTWQQVKPDMPFGTVPILEVTKGGKKTQIGTSLAVGRYVATLTGQYGSSQEEQGEIDAIVDVANDLREDAISYLFIKDEEEKEKKKKEYEEKAVKKLTHLATMLNKNDYFIGNKMSWADIHFLGCFEMLKKKAGQEKLLDAFPTLEALYKRVESNVNIQKYIKNRPETSM